MGFDDGGGCGRGVTTRGLRAGLNDRGGRGGRWRGGVGVVRGHHAGEDGRDGGRGRQLGGGGLWWGRVGGGGAMRNEEGPTVDPWRGVLRVARFGVTWRPEIVSIRWGGCQVSPLHAVVSTRPCSGLIVQCSNVNIGGAVPNGAPLFLICLQLLNLMKSKDAPQCERLIKCMCRHTLSDGEH